MLDQYIRERMGELGLSGKDVAGQSGGRLTPSAVYMICRGERVKLSPDSWLALSDVLQVPVRDLMELADGREPVPG